MKLLTTTAGAGVVIELTAANTLNTDGLRVITDRARETWCVRRTIISC